MTQRKLLWRLLLSAGLCLSFLALGCEEVLGPVDPIGADELEYEIVPEGKMDDYRSTRGQEYILRALDFIMLPAADADLEGEARMERAEELVEHRFTALSFFIYAYLSKKSSHDENADYGDFRTTIRQQTFESLEITERVDEPGTFDFIFEAECAGPKQLISQLPVGDNGTFPVILPIISPEELESGSYSTTYRDFDPANFESDVLTSIDVEIEEAELVPDSYPEYNRLFEDGVVDIAIHVGGDYNESRSDLRKAREFFDYLRNDFGLTAPVESFEELTSTSGPFTTTFDANGSQIRLEVYLYHPDMHQEEGVGYDGLLDLYRQSAAIRDIVIYTGHAGYTTSYSGVVVSYNPRIALAMDDFSALEMPETYQIFMFSGCRTYSAYADALYANPAKDTANLDIITTVNPSYPNEAMRVIEGFIENLTETQEETHAPRSWDHLLSDMNRSRSMGIIYGVHGLSDNPRISPWADPSTLCNTCESNSECPGIDNLCSRLTIGDRVCTVACSDDSGCPDDYTCMAVASRWSDVISRYQCAPQAGYCE